MQVVYLFLIIDCIALANQGDHALGSGRPSVCLTVCLCRGSALLSAAESNKRHYQSKMFVCNLGAYNDSSADAVDQLLIIEGLVMLQVSSFMILMVKHGMVSYNIEMTF